MCVIFFALNTRQEMPLVLIANRDEFYARPTRTSGYWEDFPTIYGGRDLQGGGTWLGVTDTGRFAAVTNYRDPSAPTGTRSRGELVAGFLKGDQTAQQYLENIRSRSNDYSGFNLLVGETDQNRAEVHYFSNRGDDPRQLSPGIYGLSNHLLDTPWPKVEKGKARFTDMLRSGETSNENFFEILSDKSVAADQDLPSTGIPYEAEKAISAVFIKTSGYGTRCSTVLRFDTNLEWSFEERVFV